MGYRKFRKKLDCIGHSSPAPKFARQTSPKRRRGSSEPQRKQKFSPPGQNGGVTCTKRCEEKHGARQTYIREHDLQINADIFVFFSEGK